MGSNVSPEDRQLSKELAFRNLKSLSRKGMNANVGMNIYTRFSTKGAMNAAPSPGKNMKGPMEAISFELLSSMEQQGLKAALKGAPKSASRSRSPSIRKGRPGFLRGRYLGPSSWSVWRVSSGDSPFWKASFEKAWWCSHEV